MRIESVEEEDADVEKVAAVIRKEALSIPFKKDLYNTHIDNASAKEDVSPTLLKLLSCISNKFTNDSLSALLFGNMITSQVANRPTDLLISLCIMVREKKLIEHL
jgi:hypothetical protein